MNILIILTITLLSFIANSFPVPKDNKATFDIIRKNKIIGSVETSFYTANDNLVLETTLDIDIKILFIPAYKFHQNSKEVWFENQLIEFDGYTDFEDEREYFIKGKNINNNFVVTGMDGEIITDKNIISLNYWNKNIINQNKILDTQKGIIREIKVERLKDEIIKINNIKIETEKYILNASSHPKDKGPFPEYTIWYDKNDELVKFKFTNWKDKKEVITQRNDLYK